METSPTTAIRELAGHDPLPWVLWCLACRACHKIKSRILAVLLRAPGLFIAGHCKVSGIRHLRIGRNFYVPGDLWIDAVTRYGGQRFTPSIVIGDDVRLSPGAHITAIDRIVIGSGVLAGSRIYISDHNHGEYAGSTQSSPWEAPAERRLGGGGPVIIGDNVWIGENVVILGPANIGAGAILAANSVVRGDVPAMTMVGGIPARRIKQFQVDTQRWERLEP